MLSVLLAAGLLGAAGLLLDRPVSSRLRAVVPAPGSAAHGYPARSRARSRSAAAPGASSPRVLRLPREGLSRASALTRQRRDAHERAHAREALAALAAEVRAGAGPLHALEQAAAGPGSVRRRLAEAAAAGRLGADPAEVLAGPVSDRGAAAELLVPLSAVWRLCAGTGAGLAPALEQLDRALAARQELSRTVAAELAGPRATALLLAALPLAGTALAAGLGARPLHVLLGTPLGRVCLVLGLLLDGAGLLWTRRLARGAGA